MQKKLLTLLIASAFPLTSLAATLTDNSDAIPSAPSDVYDMNSPGYATIHDGAFDSVLVNDGSVTVMNASFNTATVSRLDNADNPYMAIVNSAFGSLTNTQYGGLDIVNSSAIGTVDNDGTINLVQGSNLLSVTNGIHGIINNMDSSHMGSVINSGSITTQALASIDDITLLSNGEYENYGQTGSILSTSANTSVSLWGSSLTGTISGDFSNIYLFNNADVDTVVLNSGYLDLQNNSHIDNVTLGTSGLNLRNEVVLRHTASMGAINGINGDISIYSGSLGDVNAVHNLSNSTLSVYEDAVNSGHVYGTMTLNNSTFDNYSNSVVMDNVTLTNNSVGNLYHANMGAFNLNHSDATYFDGTINNMTMTNSSSLLLNKALSLDHLTSSNSTVLFNNPVDLDSTNNTVELSIANAFSGSLHVNVLNLIGGGLQENSIKIIDLLNDTTYDETVTIGGTRISHAAGFSIAGAYQIDTSPYAWVMQRQATGWFLNTTPIVTADTARFVSTPVVTLGSTLKNTSQEIRDHITQQGEKWDNVWGNFTRNEDTIDVNAGMQLSNQSQGFNIGYHFDKHNNHQFGVMMGYKGNTEHILQSAGGLSSDVENGSDNFMLGAHHQYTGPYTDHLTLLIGGYTKARQNYRDGQMTYDGFFGEISHEVRKSFRYGTPYLGVQAQYADIGYHYSQYNMMAGLDFTHKTDAYSFTAKPHVTQSFESHKNITLSDGSTFSITPDRTRVGVDFIVKTEDKENNWFVKVGNNNLKHDDWSFIFGGSFKF